MAAAGPAEVPAEAPAGVAGKPPAGLFGGCTMCRWVCGSGLLLAAVWIYSGPRNHLRRGIPPTMGTIAQITFALSVGAWGMVILVDPVGKQIRKEP